MSGDVIRQNLPRRQRMRRIINNNYNGNDHPLTHTDEQWRILTFDHEDHIVWQIQTFGKGGNLMFPCISHLFLHWRRPKSIIIAKLDGQAYHGRIFPPLQDLPLVISTQQDYNVMVVTDDSKSICPTTHITAVPRNGRLSQPFGASGYRTCVLLTFAPVVDKLTKLFRPNE